MFKRQDSVVKIWQLIGGPLAAGAPSHGTTSTVVNLALSCHQLIDVRAVLIVWRM